MFCLTLRNIFLEYSKLDNLSFLYNGDWLLYCPIWVTEGARWQIHGYDNRIIHSNEICRQFFADKNLIGLNNITSIKDFMFMVGFVSLFVCSWVC